MAPRSTLGAPGRPTRRPRESGVRKPDTRLANVNSLRLFLFTTDLDLALSAEGAGVDSVVVDWERRGKAERQWRYALEVNDDSPQDVRALAARLRIPVTVRIDPLGEGTPMEVDLALGCGAGVVMLPMARSSDDVRSFLDIVDGRARTLVQVETPQLASDIERFSTLGWDYAYIGLNDLMVARGGHSIWQALIDGTAETICAPLRGRVFGFGGATVIGGGEPIFNALILLELVRLGGSLAVMRRTFKRELLDRELGAELKALRAFIEAARRRGPHAMAHDRAHLHDIIAKMIDAASAAGAPAR